jgi:RNA polymerase sigma factor (sigma-70 family)
MSYKAILSDQVLFEAFKRGDQHAFMEVYQTFKKAVYAFTVRIVRSAEEAEDLTVQAFVRVWEHRSSIDSMAHLKNFLFISVRNSSINYLQARRRSEVELTTAVAEEIDSKCLSHHNNDILFTELVEDILALIETMPKLRGTVFRMRFLEEQSAQQVSQKLGLSIHGVYWHTKEAVAQAREVLQKKGHRHSKVLFLLLLLVAADLIGGIL